MLVFDDVWYAHRDGDRIVPVLEGVSFHVGKGEFVSLVGPSGAGKSTIFQLIAGLREPDRGRIVVDGRADGRLGRVGYMPQQDLLLPWRTVLDNAVLPQEIRGVSRKAARERARRLLAEFGLTGFERAYPHQLSGGMRQRVAFLRTVMTDTELLLLDEPFGALDAFTRATMQEWLLDAHGRLGKTVLLVTHDIEEAVLLSDRVYVLPGRPARRVHEVAVPLERPRRYGLVTTPAFQRIRRDVLALLAGQQGAAGGEGR